MNSRTRSSSEDLSKVNKKQRSSYDPNSEGEAMSDVRLYDIPLQETLDYLNGDINPIKDGSNITSYKTYYSQFKFFGRTLKEITGAEPALASAANLILHGGKKEAEIVLSLIKEHPIFLHIETEGKDPLGRRVRGTLLQIAAMAGDVNLKTNIKNENDQGIVEMLVAAGNLTKEEVEEQLKCITSKEAQFINEQRNKHILEAIKKFGEEIIKIHVNYNVIFGRDDRESYRTRQIYLREIKPLIDQLNKNLQPDTEEVITAGLVFDPNILYEASKWFEYNLRRFGGWKNYKSDTFWVLCMGKLQCSLSARDLQMLLHGKQCGNVERSVYCRWKQSSHYDAGYLGIEMFLGCYGGSQYDTSRLTYIPSSQFYNNLCQTKIEALEDLCTTMRLNLK